MSAISKIRSDEKDLSATRGVNLNTKGISRNNNNILKATADMTE